MPRFGCGVEERTIWTNYNHHIETRCAAEPVVQVINFKCRVSRHSSLPNLAVAAGRHRQATEEELGSGGKRVPTLLFNGYAEFVADIYKGLEKERLWA
jgi:hypothetical protein